MTHSACSHEHPSLNPHTVLGIVFSHLRGSPHTECGKGPVKAQRLEPRSQKLNPHTGSCARMCLLPNGSDSTLGSSRCLVSGLPQMPGWQAGWLARGSLPGPDLGLGHLMVFYHEGMLGTPGNSSQEEMQQPRPSVAAGQTSGTSSIHGILGQARQNKHDPRSQ